MFVRISESNKLESEVAGPFTSSYGIAKGSGGEIVVGLVKDPTVPENQVSIGKPTTLTTLGHNVSESSLNVGLEEPRSP